jgi:MoaE-MoaD fusion protein
LLIAIVLLLAPHAEAQPRGDAILFVWDDVLLAQSLTTRELLTTDYRYTGTQPLPPTQPRSVYNLADSGLPESPLDGYGFYQGVRSDDQTRLAFLAIQPDDAGYHVIMAENGVQRTLFSGEVGGERGYLVPIGWADDGALMLLERHLLHNLQEVRLWMYREADGALELRRTLAIPSLSGNSATLDDGTVFIGFDTASAVAYFINVNTSELSRAPTGLLLPNPPSSVFETYPISVLGITNLADLDAWLAQNSSPANDDSRPTEPFLHWMLPDDARSITCYPDSDWTDMQHTVECAGLTVPREYVGHQGTDVGGRPDGLPVGTPVYAAARGVVALRYIECPPQDVACGDSYGNYVLLEHARVINGDVETWFTGYAHLQTVLAQPNAYIRQIGIPIALSGDTGLGGAHLHFEVRSPQHPAAANWLDPWDIRLGLEMANLWIGGSQPLAAVVAAPPPAQLTCQTAAGNNIRSGPGTDFAVVSETTAATPYEVIHIQTVSTGMASGAWYFVRWSAGATGWIFADLMTTCTPANAGSLPVYVMLLSNRANRSTMNVKVLLFATLKDALGRGETALFIPAPDATLAQVRAALVAQHPALERHLEAAIGAVNQEYAFPNDVVHDGDEVAFFPPVSGGADYPEVCQLADAPLDLDALMAAITVPATGAVCVFSGMVRGETHTDDGAQQTAHLEYEAYAPMALAKMRQVAAEIRAQYPGVQGIAIVQRVGKLDVGQNTILIMCGSGHRDGGCFEAARYGIDRLKEIVPVWKREVGTDGAAWVEGAYMPSAEDKG